MLQAVRATLLARSRFVRCWVVALVIVRCRRRREFEALVRSCARRHLLLGEGTSHRNLLSRRRRANDVLAMQMHALETAPAGPRSVTFASPRRRATLDGERAYSRGDSVLGDAYVGR